jgi:hypothetical protein
MQTSELMQIQIHATKLFIHKNYQLRELHGAFRRLNLCAKKARLKQLTTGPDSARTNSNEFDFI